jgi:hypothetical protein
MNTITRDELKALTQEQAGWCVSLFMPAHRSAAETQQDQIRFKNLLREAEAHLLAGGLRATEARALLEPAQQLASEGVIWRQPSDGLAVFISARLFRYYQLPLAFEAVVVVAQRFHLKPLLPLLSDEGHFYVLALSQNAVRLLKGTPHTVKDVPLEGVPQSMAEAMRFEEPNKQIQWHTIGSPGRGGPIPVFHGQGTGIDDTKERLVRYFQKVNAGLHKLLCAERAPLILAAVGHLMPIYREVNTYPHLMEEGIAGNAEERSAAELHAAAWAIVQPHVLRVQHDTIEIYHEYAGGARASHDLATIVRAAHEGRVQRLLVVAGAQRWGTFDLKTESIVVHAEQVAGDEDLLDRAAVETYLHGGTVHALPSDALPEKTPVVALFRSA